MRYIILKILLLVCAFLLCIELFGQNNHVALSRETFEGVWQSYDEPREYFIIKNDYYISIYISNNEPLNIDFWRYGFVTENDYNSCKLDKDKCLPVSSIKDKGHYFFVYTKEDFPESGCLGKSNTIYYGYSIDDVNSSDITIEYVNVLEYHRSELPKDVELEIVEKMSKRGLSMPRTYLYNSWEHCGRVRSPRAIIYSKPDIPTKMYFIYGDGVRILEQRSDWFHVEFHGRKIIDGWIKMSDIIVVR